MTGIQNIIDRATKSLLAIFVAALAIGLFVNVLFRYVFSLPLFWTEEICTLLLVWIVFLGAVDLHKMGKHIAVDTLYVRCPPGVKAVMDTIGQIVIVCVLAVLIVSSVKAFALQSRSTTTHIGMPVSMFGAATLLSATLMFIYTIMSVARRIRRFVTNRPYAVPGKRLPRRRSS